MEAKSRPDRQSSPIVSKEIRALPTSIWALGLGAGTSLLLASIIAGALWTVIGASATFLAGATFAALAVLGLILYRGKP